MIRRNSIIVGLLAALVNALIFNWTISIKCAPKAEEKFNVFVCAKDCLASDLENDIYKLTSNNGIRKSTVYSINENDSYAYKYFDSVHESVDLYIVPESYFSTASYFGLCFEESSINDLVSEAKNSYLYSENGYGTGICLFDQKNELEYCTKYITFNNENRYFVIIPKSSVHSGKLNNKNSSLCFKILSNLIYEK